MIKPAANNVEMCSYDVRKYSSRTNLVIDEELTDRSNNAISIFKGIA